MKYDKDEITIILPCFNEEPLLAKIIDNFKKMGFNNILVIDDASIDNTNKVAQSADVDVIKNSILLGYSMSLLKGLYHVKTKTVFICSAFDNIVFHDNNLTEFIEFGLIGKYSMLISRGRPDNVYNISPILKKRFGISIPEPGFEAVFLNDNLLTLIKNKVSGTKNYIHFDIIRELVINKLKIGVYPVKLHTAPQNFGVVNRIYQTLGIGKYMGIGKYIRSKKSLEYFDYAFPDLDKKQIRREVTIAVISPVFCYILIKCAELFFEVFK